MTISTCSRSRRVTTVVGICDAFAIGAVSLGRRRCPGPLLVMTELRCKSCLVCTRITAYKLTQLNAFLLPLPARILFRTLEERPENLMNDAERNATPNEITCQTHIKQWGAIRRCRRTRSNGDCANCSRLCAQASVPVCCTGYIAPTWT